MAKEVRKDLGFLGMEYQYKLIKCLIEDPNFFVHMCPIIDQNMFTDDKMRRIVGLMKDRYEKTNVVSTYEDLRLMIRTKITDGTSASIIESVLNEIIKMNLSGIDIIEEDVGKFFKQQNLIKAINQANDIIKKGSFSDYYRIEDLIVKAIEVNTNTDESFHIFEHLEKDLEEDYRNPIPTGSKELDESLYGGLGKGELGIIVAPMGVGKTSIVTGFAAGAALYKCPENNNQGFKVLHFFFEDNKVSIKRKYFGYLLDIDACTLSRPDIRPIAIDRLNSMEEKRYMIQNNIICERLSTGEITASEIKAKIKSSIAKGFKPDLVIIDYFECLKHEKNNSGDSEWSEEGKTMRKLESTANELNIGIWVPVQGTKSSIGQEYVGLMHAGGSVTKTQIGHVVITLARTDEQKKNGRLSLYIQKLRASKIGRTEFINIKFNNGTCKLDMSDSLDDDVEFGKGNYQIQSMNVAKNIKNNYYQK